MKVTISDNLWDRREKALDRGVERGMFDRVPTEEEIEALLDQQLEQLEEEVEGRLETFQRLI